MLNVKIALSLSKASLNIVHLHAHTITTCYYFPDNEVSLLLFYIFLTTLSPSPSHNKPNQSGLPFLYQQFLLLTFLVHNLSVCIYHYSPFSLFPFYLVDRIHKKYNNTVISDIQSFFLFIFLLFGTIPILHFHFISCILYFSPLTMGCLRNVGSVNKFQIQIKCDSKNGMNCTHVKYTTHSIYNVEIIH